MCECTYLITIATCRTLQCDFSHLGSHLVVLAWYQQEFTDIVLNTREREIAELVCHVLREWNWKYYWLHFSPSLTVTVQPPKSAVDIETFFCRYFNTSFAPLTLNSVLSFLGGDLNCGLSAEKGNSMMIGYETEIWLQIIKYIHTCTSTELFLFNRNIYEKWDQIVFTKCRPDFYEI